MQKKRKPKASKNVCTFSRPDKLSISPPSLIYKILVATDRHRKYSVDVSDSEGDDTMPAELSDEVPVPTEAGDYPDGEGK